MERIYLDNNATTGLDPLVAEAVIQQLTEVPGNPSSVHWYGQQARATLTLARRQVARYLGVKAPEILFTSGGTEAANQLMAGLLGAGDHMITSDQEHSCVFTTAEALQSEGVNVSFLHPGAAGAVTPEMLAGAFTDKTKLVLLTAVNTETGVKTDIDALAALCAERGVPLCVDGVGLIGREALSLPEGVHAMFFSGHKIHAPKGVGVLFLRQRFKVPALLQGGGQEFQKRAGTENLSGIVGMGKAVDLLNEVLPEASEKMRALRDRFESGLRQRLPEIVIHGEQLARVVNTSCIGFPGMDGETLLMHLDLHGVACSHGSACSSGAMQPSRVLLNMEVPRDLAAASLRFSVSRFTSEKEIDRAVEIIAEVVSQLQVLKG